MNSKDKTLLQEAYLKVLLKENPEPQSSNTWYVAQIDEYGGDLYTLKGSSFENAVANQIKSDKFALGFDVEGEFHNDPTTAVEVITRKELDNGGTSDRSWFQIYGPGFRDVSELPQSPEDRMKEYDLNR